jgi:glycosyltransferase involved in cell wall biosynthesis
VALTALPWLAWTALRTRRRPRLAALVDWQYKQCVTRRLQQIIRRERPDILHVKGRLVAEAWPVFPPERTIYHHALSGTVDPSWTAPEVAAFRDFANRIARVFAPGQGVAATLARSFGLTRPVDALFAMAPDELGERDETGNLKPESESEQEKVSLTPPPSTLHPPPGLPTQQLTTNNPELAPAPLRFGILCRFTEQKGIVHILEALRQFRDRHGAVAFTFAGQGPLEPEIVAYARRHRLDGVRVSPVPSVPDILRALDVFVHPGLDDAMPVSIVEALMFGVPCIATRVGGVPDLVRDGEEGFLIEPGAAAPILDAMERFARLTPAAFAAFRERARARYLAVCRPAAVGAVVAEHYRAILAAAQGG